jgi:hypothetical protein
VWIAECKAFSEFRIPIGSTTAHASPVEPPDTPVTQEANPRTSRSQKSYHFSSHLGRLLRSEGRSQTKREDDLLTTATTGVQSSISRPKH